MGYRYKAIKDGTLSNPYRHIKAGDIVELNEPVKSSWLVSPDLKEPGALPLMPYMNMAGSKVERVAVPPIAPREDYDRNINTLLAREAKDVPIINPPVPVPVVPPAYRTPTQEKPSGEAQGTGSQEAF